MVKASPSVTATRKVWIAKGRKRLVADGDPDAAALFAIRGQTVKLDLASRFEGAAGFFSGFPTPGELPKPVEAKPKRERAAKTKG